MPSSVIAAMHYNAEARILTIVYREAFRAAPSKGTYLNEVFKNKEYRYERERNF
jgi:hypothetical protein